MSAHIRRTEYVRIVSWCLFACCLVGCHDSAKQQIEADVQLPTGPMAVHVVNYPLQYFAERIGGEQARVVFPVPADEDPAFWTPDAEAIAAFQRAEVILLNGASYAKWTQTVSLPRTKVVDTSASCSGQFIKTEDTVTHAHGPGGEHAHGGTAFTIWLDPQLAAAQADTIRETFARLRPQHEAEFRKNFAALESDLNVLDAEIRRLVDGKADRSLLFSHPVYQYLSRRYDLNGESVHFEPDEVPSQKKWDELTSLLEQHPAKWMVWEGEPVEENVKRLNQLGVQSTVFDPCGNVPQGGDLLDVMRQNIENLRPVFADVP